MIDAPTRVFHWFFAACFLGAYACGDSDSWRSVHVALGYMMIALLAFRVVYGLLGPRHVRLSALFRRAKGWSAWFDAIKSRSRNNIRAPQLQTLWTATVVIAMIGFALLTFVTGYAAHYKWGWVIGQKVFEVLHEFAANGFIGAAIAHVSGLALFSLIRLRNLARPMVTGLSRGEGPDLIKHQRVWLGWALAFGTLSFGIWQWSRVI